MNKTKSTTRVFINTLNANDLFCLPGESTIYVCETRRSEPGNTRVTYRVLNSPDMGVWEYNRPGLSTVALLN